MNVGPELIWIFSSGRSGTTWLMRLLGGTHRAPMWSEPRFGRMLHQFVDAEGWRPSSGHLLSEAERGAFVAGVGAFVRTVASHRYPDDERVVVKEPAGSAGAPLISEALPETRLVTVVRDLRDVVASSVDGKRPGHWQNRDGSKWGGRFIEEEFTHWLTENSVKSMQGAIDAYDQHAGPKSLVRYEDLRSDTLRSMRRITRDLDLPHRPRRLEATIAKHDFNAVPAERRGEGQFFRKATPGSWRQDLTAEQIAVVEEAGRPIMDRFYPGWI